MANTEHTTAPTAELVRYDDPLLVTERVTVAAFLAGYTHPARHHRDWRVEPAPDRHMRAVRSRILVLEFVENAADDIGEAAVASRYYMCVRAVGCCRVAMTEALRDHDRSLASVE